MSVSWIGPVAVTIYEPKFSWGSAPDASGARDASIGGLVEWTKAHQLSELVDNAARRVTVGSHAGVLEFVYADDAMLRAFRGWYLLESFELSAEHRHSLSATGGVVGFTLAATYLGDHREVVVARSARARTNSFALAPASVLANPFWGEDAGGEPFVVSAGGTLVTRTYDPTTPHDSSRTTAPGGARQLGLYVGSVSGASDTLAAVAVPDLETGVDHEGQATPRWVSDRGGDVRAFDRREGREVHGPAHPFVASTDAVVTNGVLRAWCGPRGLPPYLQVQAFVGTTWREVGYVHLARPDGAEVLTSARLVHLTPEAATLALRVEGQGEVLVTLRRGERMLRIRHGTSRAPRVSATRRVGWAGLPPWNWLTTASLASGRYGLGLADTGAGSSAAQATWADPQATWADDGHTWSGGAGAHPDVRPRWPGSRHRIPWTVALWYRPNAAAAALAGAGLLSVFDTLGETAVDLRLDPADVRFKLRAGPNTVASAGQAFGAGSDVFLAARLSAADGLALSVASPAAALGHTKAPAATDPGTAASYADMYFAWTPTSWGDGTWGDHSWGGDLTWPKGVIDNLMIFDGYLSDAEVAALAGASTALGGLPAPEGRLIYHVAFEARPRPAGSTTASGRRHETDASGARWPDSWGLTKGLGALSGVAAAADGLALYGSAEGLDIAAYLATTAGGDDVADHHNQFAADSEQEVRVR